MSTRSGLVALLGLPNGGKSSIINALVGQKIAPTSFKPQTTRRSIRGIVTQGDVQIVFVDTPGLVESSHELQSYMREQALSALHEVDVIVWVIDAPHWLAKAGQQAHEEEKLAFLLKVTEPSKPIVLVLNKIDRIEDKLRLLPLIEKYGKEKRFAAVVPISAAKGDGLQALSGEIDKFLPEQAFHFDADMITDAPERDIVAELIREKVMVSLGEEIPYQIAVTIDSFDESRRIDTRKPIVEVSAILHVERESQKKIVIGHKGEKLKEIGMTARKELEALLGCQVMLKLFVRVEPNWSQTAKGLRKIGYL
jgi:GTP-binding protein Era